MKKMEKTLSEHTYPANKTVAGSDVAARCPHCGHTSCGCSDETKDRATRWKEHVLRETEADEEYLFEWD